MRFSAMGDAAMTVPVLQALATQHPELHITMLTRTRLVPLFANLPPTVEVKGINLNEYDGIAGLSRLYKQLKELNFDAVADLHDVLRTKYLRVRFAMGGTRVAVVDKGRKERKLLLKHECDGLSLRPMAERYADVFRQLGLPTDLSLGSPLQPNGDWAKIHTEVGQKAEGEKWVGIAPFAAHAQKIYPLERMQQVAEQLAKHGCTVMLFGAGKDEKAVLSTWQREWQERHPSNDKKGRILNLCDKLGGLENEILLMSELDMMLSMDSANMHIASIVGTPVLSVWGATHPKAGFSGYGQAQGMEIQRDLPCRPCSIYGKKKCRFGDLRCMDIAAETIVAKALNLLKEHPAC